VSRSIFLSLLFFFVCRAGYAMDAGNNESKNNFLQKIAQRMSRPESLNNPELQAKVLAYKKYIDAILSGQKVKVQVVK
jgi:hypothetical protein